MSKAKRYDTRVHKTIRVKVSGTDRYGNRFRQTASTLNISRSGARLDGVPLVKDADTIEVSRGWFRKARFRVVWAGEPGTSEASQVGIRCVESNGSAIWGIDFPPPQPSNWKAPRQEAASVSAIPESGPIPVQWDSYDADRPMRFADSGVKEPIVHAADAVPKAWRDESRKSAGERRVPITLRWNAQGKEVEENLVMARVLKDGSCMVSLKNAALEGTEVSVTHGYSGEKRAGKISWCGPRTAEGGCPASIELTPPDLPFWDAAPSFGG